MESLIIFLVMTVCVFLPIIVFGIVGYNALVQLGKRPMEGGKVMTALVLKLTVTSAIIIALLAFLLEVFG